VVFIFNLKEELNKKIFFTLGPVAVKVRYIGFGSGNNYSTTLAIAFDVSGVVKNHNITWGATSSGAPVGD
jgi:hypothetical protein